MATHNDLGKFGESTAQDYLQKNGYEIVEVNYRYGNAEIDIVAKLGKMLVFVEVKTRSTLVFGNPEDAVTRKKQQLMLDAASKYMYDLQYDDEIRFDIISLVVDANMQVKELKHFEDAFFFF